MTKILSIILISSSFVFNNMTTKVNLQIINSNSAIDNQGNSYYIGNSYNGIGNNLIAIINIHGEILGYIE